MNRPTKLFSTDAAANRQSWLGTAFLAAVFFYDAWMLADVHRYQTSLDAIATSFAPIHPALPRLGAVEPILPVKHLWWVLMAHGVASAIPLLGSVLQNMAPIRRRWPAFHRWNGRLILLVIAPFTAGIGMWMAPDVLHASAALRFCIGGLGVITLVASWMTFRTARQKHWPRHSQWALRLTAYLHVIPLFARLYFWFAWVFIFADAENFAQAQNTTFEWIGWGVVLSVVPLGELAARIGGYRPSGMVSASGISTPSSI